ncbi:TonB-dependent receptor plug domain-containing protein [Pseudomonas sp. P7758]|uniref:TonB-dependent receptor plug domain-containing protein n=1 Tax=Pseudomonas sp. P7758 TaxID=2738830 RepID=UPI00210DCDE9|nr:Plug domain-containing protein [Pseudomonas sp. P7758]
MRQLFEPRARRFESLATASSLGVLLMLIHGAAFAAQADPTLATVVVTGAEATEAQKAEKQLSKVPGKTAVIDNRKIEQGRAANAEDVLALQPGVFAQATSGSGANKISIRGSGLNTFYQGYVLGIKFLYDGLPLTGPGGTQEDMLDMASVDHTEVLYGANAFRYSAFPGRRDQLREQDRPHRSGQLRAFRSRQLRLSQGAIEHGWCGRRQ